MSQWNNSGGSLPFHGDTCRIEPTTQFSLNLYAPFSSQNDAHHSVHPTEAYAQVDIPSDLLHRRVGHRSIQALGISLVLNEDTFCRGCETTFLKEG